MLPSDARQMDLEPYRRAITTCAPKLTSAPMTYLSEGWDNVAIDVDDRFIFRFPRREENVRQLEMERLLVQEIARTSPLPVPNFVYSGRDVTTGWLFLGHEKIAGSPLTVTGLDVNQTDRLAQQLGAFLSALHAFPADQAERMGVPVYTLPRWAAHWQGRLAEAQERVLPLLSATEQGLFSDLWKTFFRSLEERPFHPVLIHNDLSMRHVLLDQEAATITGVIDWGDAAIADPAMDFAGILHLQRGRPFMERVLARYYGPADNALPFRAAFYSLTALAMVVQTAVQRGDAVWARSAVEDLKGALRAEDGRPVTYLE